MKKVNIFLDSSALIAGIISETGAAHVLLQLGETEDIILIISEMVVNETKRSIARKSPDNLDDVQKEIKKSRARIVPDPSEEEVQANLYLMDDPNDVPILLAAITAKVDYPLRHTIISIFLTTRKLPKDRDSRLEHQAMSLPGY